MQLQLITLILGVCAAAYGAAVTTTDGQGVGASPLLWGVY